MNRRKRRRKILILGVLVFILLTALLARNNSRQRWAFGVPILRAEKVLGPAILWPIKRLYGIDFSFTEESMRNVFYLQMTPLEALELRRNIFRARMLIDAGINPNLQDERGVSLAVLDVKHGGGLLAELLAEVPEFNARIRDEEGTPLLHLSILRKVHRLQYEIMARGRLDPLETDAKGNTALHVAIQVQDPKGIYPFMANREWSFPALVRAKNHAGETALSLASHVRGLPIEYIRFLLRFSDIDEIYPEQKTALILAVEDGNTDLVSALVEQAARLDARDAAGRTALYYASRLRDDDCLQALARTVWTGDIEALINEVREDRRELFREMVAKARAKRATMLKSAAGKPSSPP